MHRFAFSAALLFCLPLSLLFTGCGNGGPGGHMVPAPVVTLVASPSSINSGASSTLTVTATNATTVSLTGGGNSYTLTPNGGTQSVSPTATTTYTVTATGAGGSASATATVTVASSTPAPTVSIAASPNSITAGASSTLTVTATNATSVTLTGGGSTYPLQPSGGTQSVSPTATTTYTATATGAGGTVTATTTVTLVAAVMPTVSIVASPISVPAGSPSVLTVVATNATTVTVTGGGVTLTLDPTGGAPSVSPTATTTYTATATGPGGTASATAVVTVQPSPAPTVTLSANPAAITPGSSSLLTVTATNATSVTLSGGGSTTNLQPSGGTQSVKPTATTTYTATATGPGGTITATATVTVTANPPPTVSITATPSSIVAGATSTLTVSSLYANSVVITGTDGSSYSLQSTNGTQIVTPSGTTTYTATATGDGGTASATATVTVTSAPPPTVTIEADPATIASGNSSLLTVIAANASSVVVTAPDGTDYTFPQATGGTYAVSPTANTTYTVTATGGGLNVTATASVTVVAPGTVDNIDHVIFMLQENHTFDDYFGMLNPYRTAMGFTTSENGDAYTVDGIDDKLNTITNTNDQGTVIPLFKFTTTCIDDMSSAWLESYGDVNRYNFTTTRSINMDGFVHTAEGFANSCAAGGCSGQFTDTTGQRAMGYYDQGFLNYYYYMASQFALSDRWFSPVASKSISNRIATFTGGTTQGLTKDPGSNDHLGQLNINNIFEELDQANVSWKIYYTVTQGACLEEDDCNGGPSALYPAVNFTILQYSYRYIHENKTPPCAAPTVGSSAIGDTTNSFCIDLTHIAPISQYYTDLANGTLPSFAFIEAGYGKNDEHPGSGQPILSGQTEMSKILNAFMTSPEWKDSVFFFSYDEGGGPYDHVPPVPGHTNDYTDASQVANYPVDISSIAVNPDQYNPCVPPTPPGTATVNCDLTGAANTEPGATPGDAAYVNGFAAQLGFRLPNIVISPFAREHYVDHIPMDHTAVIEFVENRFIGPNAHLTARDEAQPNLADPVNGFFDFTDNNNTGPWATPPTPPTPYTSTSTCNPQSMGP